MPFRHLRPLQAASVAMVVAWGMAAQASGTPTGWRTYRSAAFGFEFSYPPDMELRVFFGGRSGELRDAGTGQRLVELEVWPGDQCPRQPPGTRATAIGTQRAVAITQADGADGSSACGEPVITREFLSHRDVHLYELDLTCVGERYAIGADETEDARLVRKPLGKKGPTFFADISQSRTVRVLMVDPVGVDPRVTRERNPIEPAAIRDLLETLVTFPISEPGGLCIEDLRPADPRAVP